MKKNQKDSDDFNFESPILALRDKAAKLGKESQDAYNQGGWLILQELLKNWVAKGVASEMLVKNDINP